MNIGIDAKWFFDGPPSGRIVCKNLIHKFIELNTQHDLLLILDRKAKGVFIPGLSDKTRLSYVWAGNNLIANTLILPVVGLKQKIDVLLAQNFSPLWSSYKRISFIFDASFKSNPGFFTALERLYFSSMRFLSKRAHRICTISKSEKARLIKYGFHKPENIRVIPVGVDQKIFRPRSSQEDEAARALRKKYQLPLDFILYVGRLNVRKNIENLLKGISLLKNTSIPLVLAGKSDWKTLDFGNIIRRYGLTERIILTGFVEDQDLPLLYTLARLFCYISYDEGFGLPPLEAMASGIPVVVSDISPHREVCGQAACYVDPHNPYDIASKIDELLIDHNLYQEKRSLGLERASMFSWENSARELLDCFESTF